MDTPPLPPSQPSHCLGCNLLAFMTSYHFHLIRESGRPFQTLPFFLGTGLLTLLPACLYFSPSFSRTCSSLSHTSDSRFTLGSSPSCQWREGSWKPAPFSSHRMAARGRAPTRISRCDLGAVSQQTDKHITAAVVHHVQAEAPPSLDLDQAFGHAAVSFSLSLLCLSQPRAATTSHSGSDLSLAVHSVLNDLGRAHWMNQMSVPNAANRNNSGGISMGRKEGGGRYF